MPPGRPENPMTAALEDAAGKASVMLEAFTIVMARQRVNMTSSDWNEYERAIKAREQLIECLKQAKANGK
jgi:hypothetical protein